MVMLVLLAQLLLGTNCRVTPSDLASRDRFYVALAPSAEFFIQQPCGDGAAPRVEVFATPDRAKKIGEIRWGRLGYPQQFYCHALLFEARQACPRGEVLVDEIGYEERAFIAVETAGRWVRIRFDRGTGWIQLSKKDAAGVAPYEELVTGAMAQMTDAWDGRLYARPGERPRTFGKPLPYVTVVDWRRVNGKLWLEVELLEQSLCSGPQEPRIAARGWVRGYSTKRQPTVSQFSRGC